MYQAAPRIPFRPEHCPQCRWYVARLHRCQAITSEPTLDLRPLMAEYRGLSEIPCSQYDPIAEKASPGRVLPDAARLPAPRAVNG